MEIVPKETWLIVDLEKFSKSTINHIIWNTGKIVIIWEIFRSDLQTVASFAISGSYRFEWEPILHPTKTFKSQADWLKMSVAFA